jgi:hypothetical protein
MLNFICSTCGKCLQAGAEAIVCPDCNRMMTPATALAAPPDAASAKLTMPADSRTAISAGLPPYQPERKSSIAKETVSVLMRGLPFLIFGVVILTLVALCVPAVEKVREVAARTQSTNNLKQIGLAAHSFHDANKRLPFNGSSAAVRDMPYSLNAVANQPRSGSWGFQIAPFIDQSQMFAAGTSDVGIATLMCPGRGRPSSSITPALGAATPPWSDYVINPWLNDPLGGGGLTSISAVSDNKRTLAGITDGSSNTILFGHGQINTGDYGTRIATPGYMNTILIGGTTATALSSNPAAGPVTFARDSAETRRDAARGWGSPYAQGCLMSLGDATVRMFPYSLGVGSFKKVPAGSRQLGNVGSGDPAMSLASYLTPVGGEALVLGDY